MMPGHKKRREEEDIDAWLITYADMVTLLLCFFVLLFALAVPFGEKMEKLAAALRENGFYNDKGVISDPYETLKQELSLALGASGYDAFVAISKQDDAIEVELASSSFFGRGSAKFDKDGLAMLQTITHTLLPLAKKDIVVKVEGHTDDTPIATAQFPSNWELSAARAANVVRYFIAQGFPADKLEATGKGEAYPKAPNRDATGNPIPANQELNRRVVIKLQRRNR